MFKWHIIRFEEIDSTNTEAHRNLAVAKEGTVWTALYQTHGRGQYTRKWESTKGLNLLATILLRPEFLPANKQFHISKCTALAMCDFLRTLGLDPGIKWPNDIYIGPNKICGILIEHQLSGNNLTASIIGFGINVNQTVFPGLPNPTSIALETGKEYDVKSLLPKVLIHIQKWYQTLHNGKSGKIDRQYEALLINKPDYEKNGDILPANDPAAAPAPSGN